MPENLILKKCECGNSKMRPDDESVWICPECQRENEVPEETEIVRGFCPFLSTPPEKMTECIGEMCALWTDSRPYYEMEAGMCSLQLTAEAQAYISRGENLKEMGDRSAGGTAGG